MIDEPTYNELDRYVSGQLHGQELATFETRISADDGLREELIWLRGTIKAMQLSGRVVMKQHVASVIAAIPDRKLEKYRPSKNASSFWTKWWWTIVVGVVIVGVIIWYIFASQYEHKEHEHSSDENGAIASAPPDVDSAMQAPAIMSDSCDPKRIIGAVPISERVVVKSGADRESELYYEINDTGKIKPIITYSGVAEIPQNKMPMHVFLNVRNSPPYTYGLDTALTLNSAYTSAKSFTFSGQGDTVYMMDDQSNSYMLLIGKGVLPLTKLNVPRK